MRTTLAIPAVWASLSLAAAPVHASSPAGTASGEPTSAADPDAVAAFEAGSRAYALGNYADAVLHFERAFELSQRSELLFNLGQAYARWYEISGDGSHLKKARKLLQNYLAFLGAHPAASDAAGRQQAEDRLADVERQIAVDEGRAGRRDEKPVHKRAWFWVVLVGGAGLVAGGVATAVVLGRRRAEERFEPELGTIGRGLAPPGLGFRF